MTEKETRAVPTENRSDDSQLQVKRGRGRPRLPNALTPAQRAKRYRDNKRARQAAEAANRPALPQLSSEQLANENARLRLALEVARVRINDLAGALEFFVDARARHRKISADQLKGLHALLALGNPLDDASGARKRR